MKRLYLFVALSMCCPIVALGQTRPVPPVPPAPAVAPVSPTPPVPPVALVAPMIDQAEMRETDESDIQYEERVGPVLLHADPQGHQQPDDDIGREGEGIG